MKVIVNNSKNIFLGIALAVVYIMYHYIFHINISSKNIKNNIIELPIFSEIHSQENKPENVVALFVEFDKVKKDVKITPVKTLKRVPKKLGIGEVKENQQNGQLSHLYFGNDKVILTGVFFSDERFAVVSLLHLANKSSINKRLRKGQKLFDYTVTEINTKSISLIRNKQQIELKLFEK